MKTEINNQDMFHFKKFSMRNSRSGLKIGTDGVLLGAWCCPRPGTTEVWDIGCGTGIIALMVAQRCGARITGIEIDDASFEEARWNFMNSPWAERLSAVNDDIRKVKDTLPDPDVIISNPPYFNVGKALRAGNASRDSARRDASLDFRTVIEIAAQRLSDNGELWLIGPLQRLDDIQFSLEINRLKVTELLRLRTVDYKEPKRILIKASRNSTELKEHEIAIRNAEGDFTSEYKSLTKDYYLDF